MDHAEATARARTRTIPDGVYEAESFMDDDGIDVGKRMPIKVKVIVKGDEMTIDLTDVSKQVRGFYNSGDHHRLRLRAGRLQVHHLADRLSDQRRRVPQPQGDRAAGPHRQRDAAGADALVDDLPDDHRRHDLQGAAAGDPRPRHRRPSRRSAWRRRFHGINPKTSEFFIGNFGPLGGGWGAKKTEDGVSATVCINDGDTHNGPNEQAEAKFPIVVERFALIPDSGGAGRHRGGLGIERGRARADRRHGQHPERARALPAVGPRRRRRRHRQRGGAAASTAIGRPISPTPRCWWRSSSRATPSASRSGGGGGYGSPFERPVEDVREDVRQGYVSVEGRGGALRRRGRSARPSRSTGGDREAARWTAGNRSAKSA